MSFNGVKIEEFFSTSPQDVDNSPGSTTMIIPSKFLATIRNRYCLRLGMAPDFDVLIQKIVNEEFIIVPKEIGSVTTSINTILVSGSRVDKKFGQRLWERLWNQGSHFPLNWKLPNPASGDKSDANAYLRMTAKLLGYFTEQILRMDFEEFLGPYVEYQKKYVSRLFEKGNGVLTPANSIAKLIEKEAPEKIDPERTVVGKDIGNLTDQGFVYFKQVTEADNFYGKDTVAKTRLRMNDEMVKYFGASDCTELNGWVTSFQKTLKYTMKIYPLPPEATRSYLKFTFDSTKAMTNTHLLLFAVIPIWAQTQSPHAVMPLLIATSKESPQIVEAIANHFGDEIERSLQKYPQIQPIFCADYAATETLDDLNWATRTDIDKGHAALKQLIDENPSIASKNLIEQVALLNDQDFKSVKKACCPLCPASILTAMDIDTWKKVTDFKHVKIGNVTMPVVYCTVHAKLRISDKILKQILFECPNSESFDDVKELIRAVWPSFNANQTKTYVEISGLTTLESCRRILRDGDLLNNILNKIELAQIAAGASEINVKKRMSHIKLTWFLWAVIFSQLNKVTKNELPEFEDFLKQFIEEFKWLWGMDGTPYIHIVGSHTAELIRKYGCLGQFEQQGLEGAIGLHKFSAWRATSRKGGKSKRRFLFCYQILMRFLRINYYGRKYKCSFFTRTVSNQRRNAMREEEIQYFKQHVKDLQELDELTADRIVADIFLDSDEDSFFGDDFDEEENENNQENNPGKAEVEDGVLKIAKRPRDFEIDDIEEPIPWIIYD